METLLQYLTAFGLAASAGTKATIPVLALALFSFTPWFSLSPEFQWIAHPAVVIVLLGLLVLELVADAHPEVAELTNAAMYGPTVVAGFLACAAALGSVDDNLLKLVASGILGGVTSVAVRYGRNSVRSFVSDATGGHHHPQNLGSFAELGASAGLSSASILTPIAVLPLLVAGGVIVALAGGFATAKKPCVNPDCSKPIPATALACGYCTWDQP